MNSFFAYLMFFVFSLIWAQDPDIQWQKTIGGAADEWAGYAVLLDDGYIFSVASMSNESGDKTENSRGAEDYWIFKTSQHRFTNKISSTNRFTTSTGKVPMVFCDADT